MEFEFTELVEMDPTVRCRLFVLISPVVDHIPNILLVDVETALLGAINERLDVCLDFIRDKSSANTISRAA
ncbi:hypothetical protein NDI85_20955 [Halomicroarcula sp. S1AR25-4]|nr:hypothetical protein [Halomicroarcula sp. S1AR25-4]